MKARVGVCRERWDGVEVAVAHVFPIGDESEGWRADDALERLAGIGHDTRATLCGERARPHFVDGRHGWPASRWRWCPACRELDRVMRLP